MIFLLCADVFDVLEVVRQKGEFELDVRRQRLYRTQQGQLTQSGLLAATRPVSYLDAMTPAAKWKSTNRPGPFPVDTVLAVLCKTTVQFCQLLTCCCFFILAAVRARVAYVSYNASPPCWQRGAS